MWHKIRLILLTGLATVVLVACSDDYTPDPRASAETIYLEACARCHTAKPESPEMYWTVNHKNANETYIAHKVHAGSLTMPSFPNIKEKSMQRLSQFVLAHSEIE